jgi:hypothetical protein
MRLCGIYRPYPKTPTVGFSISFHPHDTTVIFESLYHVLMALSTVWLPLTMQDFI